MPDDELLTEHYKVMHLGWLLGDARMAERITVEEFKWLVDNAGEEFIAKARPDRECYEALKEVLPSLQTIVDKHGNRPKHIKDKINTVVKALALFEEEKDGT